MESLQAFWANNSDILLDIFFALLIFFVFWAVAKLVSRKLFPALIAHADKKNHVAAGILLKGFLRPASVFLKLAGVCCALLALVNWLSHHPLPTGAAVFVAGLAPVLVKTLRVAGILAVTWGLVSSSDISALVLRSARHRLDLHIGKSVSRFLQAVFNVVVIAVAAVVLMSEFSFDINGLIAGLGLGGLTIALAAKDSAANFFGGLVLVLEKPFDIGDWIVCDGVEGTVEDINLRSTKIRTVSGALTIVPNAILSGAPITNWTGSMEQRRADFTLQLLYGTSVKQMKEYAEGIRTMLETDPEITSGSAIVRFSNLSASSLDIRVIFYTSNPSFGEHLRIKERINYSLLEMAARMGVRFAFPSQSIYLQKDEKDAVG